jgi:hypothetical protein
MKTALKILLAVSALSAIAVPALAQSSAASNETTSVTIITPIAIAPVTPMAFGSVSVGVNGGTIVLPATGSPTATGDVKFVTGAGAATAASFKVTGQTGQTFTVSLSGTPLTSGANTIQISALTNSTPDTIGASGTTFTVGGTLAIAGNQAPGTYAGSVTATVAYN